MFIGPFEFTIFPGELVEWLQNCVNVRKETWHTQVSLLV